MGSDGRAVEPEQMTCLSSALLGCTARVASQRPLLVLMSS